MKKKRLEKLWKQACKETRSKGASLPKIPWSRLKPVKWFSLGLALVFVLTIAGPVSAGSCISENGGYSLCPDFDGSGALGIPTKRWGSIHTTDQGFIPLGMAAWVADGGADIDEASTPYIGVADNIPAIIMANCYGLRCDSSPMTQTVQIPDDYTDGFAINAMVSSDTDANAAAILGGSIWRNRTGRLFAENAGDGSWHVTMTSAAASATGNLSTTHEVLTISLDASWANALTPGDFITVELVDASTHATSNLELKGAQIEYNR